MFTSYITAAKAYNKTNIFNDGCNILYLEPFLHAGVTNLINTNEPFESQDSKFWCERGSTFRNSHQYDKALECCNKAIIIDPNCFEAWYIQSCVYHHHLNMFAEALDCYN
ncbi:Tetratricopeptide repeat containing protein [Candidatus Trichorickettsia mobilis]|uniref:Tetratricopeptide repeat containing protein n=1 Tax=Candidatus Trichorickettsia mobilis TaxID=1346319 RepID=A0ABZ0UVN0_9RICK|nr:tetratricopeptide repeat protein [Candidatus Trichorickettsia mobilis]WPY01240.1 Tetratricopeptide repeat containing protein [Candidatus Trichorickettsia mobilis]